MAQDENSRQRIYLYDLNTDTDVEYSNKKQVRVGLRASKDAYKLNIEPDYSPKTNVIPDVPLFRLTAYCLADVFDLKTINKYLRRVDAVSNINIYFGECLHASYSFSDSDSRQRDCYFYDYGVLVCWGMEESEETDIIKFLDKFNMRKYDPKDIEIEYFQYGLSDDPFVINDNIYISSENCYTKMVISTAIAQSTKLNYFENLVDYTIKEISDMPDQVEKEGKVKQTRKEILKVMGKLHKLRFNLNLVSNILDEPEFVWTYPQFSSVYETCRQYLDIKARVDILNKRCEIIHGVLEILSGNITTNNGERLEMIMIYMIAANVVIGIIQIIVLCFKLRPAT